MKNNNMKAKNLVGITKIFLEINYLTIEHFPENKNLVALYLENCYDDGINEEKRKFIDEEDTFTF